MLCESVKVIDDGTDVIATGDEVQVRGLPCPEPSADGLAVSSSVQ